MPGAPNQGFAVIALGKHGSRELNYSSDIDPIFLFDPETLPHRERDDVAEAAVRYGRRVIELLSVLDGDGYVFRVDMRLRPSPEVSPIVLPVEAAISYYESSALAWEQAAFIRSRVCAGDRALGDYFLNAIQPFIWRKSLDFGQLKNITAMTAAIRDHYAKGQNIGPGYDLKRGHGGIRECEFFAQAHQLIHGGRDASLRSAETREALAALAVQGCIKPEEATTLASAYEQLRTFEHRLQMHGDRQTHSIPEQAETADAVAAAARAGRWRGADCRHSPDHRRRRRHLRPDGRCRRRRPAHGRGWPAARRTARRFWLCRPCGANAAHGALAQRQVARGAQPVGARGVRSGAARLAEGFCAVTRPCKCDCPLRQSDRGDAERDQCLPAAGGAARADATARRHIELCADACRRSGAQQPLSRRADRYQRDGFARRCRRGARIAGAADRGRRLSGQPRHSPRLRRRKNALPWACN